MATDIWSCCHGWSCQCSMPRTTLCFLRSLVERICTSHSKSRMPCCTRLASNERCTSACTILHNLQSPKEIMNHKNALFLWRSSLNPYYTAKNSHKKMILERERLTHFLHEPSVCTFYNKLKIQMPNMWIFVTLLSYLNIIFWNRYRTGRLRWGSSSSILISEETCIYYMKIIRDGWYRESLLTRTILQTGIFIESNLDSVPLWSRRWRRQREKPHALPLWDRGTEKVRQCHTSR